MSEDYGLIWVCQCCILVMANGECGEIHAESCPVVQFEYDESTFPENRCNCGAREPLSAIGDGYSVTPGMGYNEHAEGCPNGSSETFGETDCDCETNTFSTSQCQGCGSYLHGERHAAHLWKD